VRGNRRTVIGCADTCGAAAGAVHRMILAKVRSIGQFARGL
jgi:hypothetical protein